MEYYSVNQYLRDTFGQKVYKIALDGGFTCPTRDGSLARGGCIFCSAEGGGDFAQKVKPGDVDAQIEKAKKRVEAKISGDGKYIAYFQSFTGTYGPVEYMKSLYNEAISNPDVVALSIATRPDCLPDEVLDMLSELNRKKPVWIELGLQTIHKKTADYIRRGYELEVYDEAVKKLNNIGIAQIIVHVILGLPGETEDMILSTVKYVADSGANGIKLQLLHVLKGTDLEKEYLAGKFQVMTMEEYVKLVRKCLEIIPRDMVVHRLTGDGDKRILVAPEWSGDKKRVLNALNYELRQ